MVFSSVPLYLNPPNWQQGNEIQNPPLPQNKPGSTGERARLGKAPAQEGPLRCPRPGCESTNTKFCYFNNYNLSQPRHFCKACRRYWTRGGALRNVPVGGACRRNKRRKSGAGAATSKSPKPASAAGQPQQQVVMNQVGPASVSAPPYSLMTSLGMGNLGQVGYGAGLGQQPVSFLAGLTAPCYSGYPFHLSEGGMETASFGSKPVMGMGGGVTENVGQFWSAHIDNRTALGNGSGGLWTDLSGIN